ncbi:hypothetical protein ABZW11_02755 [Nonomuraea sp. NPDC004580]
MTTPATFGGMLAELHAALRAHPERAEAARAALNAWLADPTGATR